MSMLANACNGTSLTYNTISLLILSQHWYVLLAGIAGGLPAINRQVFHPHTHSGEVGVDWWFGEA